MKRNKIIKLVSIISMTALLALFLVAIFAIESVDTTLDMAKLNCYSNSLTLLDCNDNIIDEPVFLGTKQLIELSELQQHTIDAFVSVEDKRFFHHNGIDYRRVIGAMANNIKTMSWKEGASTITQQLIKNTHLDNNKNIKRKVNEMVLANQLESKVSKEKILEMYLNNIYFGGNAYGLQCASKTYFNCNASELTIAQSATLAGMIKAPNVYNPINNSEKCLQRRNIVLLLMLEQNKLSENDYKTAVNNKLEVNQSATQYYSYCYGVMCEACELLNMNHSQLYSSNLTIRTYYEPRCQSALRTSVEQDTTKSGENLADVCALTVENKTGGIKAMYCRGNNGKLNEKRQIGSTAKPLAVYAPAIDLGMTSASMVLDEPTNFSGYTPHNYGDKYYGWTTFTNALSYSANVSAVKILNGIGVEKSQQYLQKMGISTSKEDNLSMALGNIGNGVDIFELAQGYTTLANNGISNKTTFIKSISNEKNNIYTNNLERNPVFDTATAYITTSMLINTAKEGTAKKLANCDFEVASKTGTVGNKNGNSDAISCSYTSDLTQISWISGNLDNKITGGTAPLEITKQFFANYYQKPPKNFTIPKDVVILDIDTNMLERNQKALIACNNSKGNVQKFAFLRDNCPTEYAIEEKMQLEINVFNDIVTIKAPATNKYSYEIHRVYDNNDKIIGRTNDILQDIVTQNGEYSYYANVYYSNQLIATTSKAYVMINYFDNENSANDNNDEYDHEDLSIGENNTENSSDENLPDKKYRNILDWFYINIG